MQPDRKQDPVLPEDNQDYSKQEYWNNRFKTEQQRDWLGGYKDFKDKLLQTHPHLQTQKDKLRVLVLGCGNSTLSHDMLQDGFKNITSIDYSPVVVQKMKIKYQAHPQLKWEVQDMMNLTAFADGSFDLVMDKGALDAFMAEEGSSWDPEEKVLRNVHQSLKQTRRVLAAGGLHVQISFQPSHFRKRYLGAKDPLDISNYDVNDNIYNWKVSSVDLGYGLSYTMYSCQA